MPITQRCAKGALEYAQHEPELVRLTVAYLLQRSRLGLFSSCLSLAFQREGSFGLSCQNSISVSTLSPGEFALRVRDQYTGI